jgi:hypothetical protein
VYLDAIGIHLNFVESSCCAKASAIIVDVVVVGYAQMCGDQRVRDSRSRIDDVVDTVLLIVNEYRS